MAATALSALAPPTPDALRDQLTAMVINDLLGPAGGEEEELDKDERVRERYLVGLCERILPGVLKCTLVRPSKTLVV